MSEEINYINLKEFIDLGYLQEVNRLFFHPRGLAMSMIIDEDGYVRVDGFHDARDDPEGFYFANDFDPGDVDRAKELEKAFREKSEKRSEMFGWVIQPLENE